MGWWFAPFALALALAALLLLSMLIINANIVIVVINVILYTRLLWQLGLLLYLSVNLLLFLFLLLFESYITIIIICFSRRFQLHNGRSWYWHIRLFQSLFCVCICYWDIVWRWQMRLSSFIDITIIINLFGIFIILW